MIVLLAGALLVAMVGLSGCKKSTPAKPEAPKTVTTGEKKVVVPVVDANKAAAVTKEAQKATTEAAKTATDAAKTTAAEAGKAATDAAKTAVAGPNTPK